MGRPMIVIAEDHDSTGRGHRDIVQHEFECIGPIADGRDVAKAVELVRPEFLFLDLALKHLNGMAILPVVRKRCPETAVIVITMYDDYFLMEEAFRLGAAAFLTKDATTRDIPRAIAAIRRGERYHSPDIQRPPRPDDPGPNASVVDTLTDQRRTILRMIAEGALTEEIAEALNVAPSTIYYHRHHIRRAIGLERDSDLPRAAVMWRHALDALDLREKDLQELRRSLARPSGAHDPPP